MTAMGFKTGEYKDAVKFFKDKINLPTKTWKDLQGEMHAKAFTVAGAMREDILCDFRKAIEKALTDGMSIGEFRKQFDQIVDKTGWQYNGTRKWRSDLIYQTNVHTAYAAGRERQMQDPKMRKIYPYARYRSMDDGRERPEHKAWNNIVLPLDDPWWDKHTPPNGWGCRCWKEPVSALEVKALGLKVLTTAPTPADDTKGIDKGWDYNVGNASWGKPGVPPNGWTITEQDGLWKDTGRPDHQLPATAAPKRSRQTEDKAEFEANFMGALEKRFGNDSDAVFAKDHVTIMKDLGGFKYPLVISPKAIGKHILTPGKDEWKPDRTMLVNFFIETVADPGEVRFTFSKSPTGKMSITANFFKVFIEEGAVKPFLFVFRAEKGCLFSWTGYRKELKQIAKLRLEGVKVK